MRRSKAAEMTNRNLANAMFKTLVAFLCMCFAVSASAKLGETLPQLVNRFGKSYTVEEGQLGKTYKFRSANVSVDVLVTDGRSCSETYFSDHALTASGEPPNEIVRAILKTNVPTARWLETDAAPFGSDYALRSSAGEYLAILKYTGPQPENTIWTMSVGLANWVRSVNTATPSPDPAPRTSTAAPSPVSNGSPTANLSADLIPATTLARPIPTPTPASPKGPKLAELSWEEVSGTIPTYPEQIITADEVQPPPERIDILKPPVEKSTSLRPSAGTESYESGWPGGLLYYDSGLNLYYLKNYPEAVKLFRKAAEQNDPRAEFYLGLCYTNGQGVPKDDSEAAKWYRKAAEQNEPWAQYNLGARYAFGQGVPKDDAEAVKWYRKAVEQNVPVAETALGFCYQQGQGVKKDDAEAVKWYRKAAEQNDPAAQTYLGVCYLAGAGLPKNYEEAVKWFRKAAEQNAPGAQSNLAVCYLYGRGVPKDYVEAYRWWLIAAAQDSTNGAGITQESVAGMEMMMTREQIAEGQRLARNFKPRTMPPVGGDSSNISIAESRPQASGTGFFITEDGYLITTSMSLETGRRCE
jgi:TPR repeat protein